ncbi:hypothetical protein PVAP13_8NG254700 [Panicum virgatum]|uniref:Uncharacterized protein n=1 Tax=Panicum virgatum TaxID=38727 RepID=A0A8T0P6M5_PANVG|nr:hypothetical protein PVAP13_8NG254700 [Panicum virgatum]
MIHRAATHQEKYGKRSRQLQQKVGREKFCSSTKNFGPSFDQFLGAALFPMTSSWGDFCALPAVVLQDIAGKVSLQSSSSGFNKAANRRFV